MDQGAEGGIGGQAGGDLPGFEDVQAGPDPLRRRSPGNRRPRAADVGQGHRAEDRVGAGLGDRPAEIGQELGGGVPVVAPPPAGIGAVQVLERAVEGAPGQPHALTEEGLPCRPEERGPTRRPFGVEARAAGILRATQPHRVPFEAFQLPGKPGAQERAGGGQGRRIEAPPVVYRPAEGQNRVPGPVALGLHRRGPGAGRGEQRFGEPRGGPGQRIIQRDDSVQVRDRLRSARAVERVERKHRGSK